MFSDRLCRNLTDTFSRTMALSREVCFFDAAFDTREKAAWQLIAAIPQYSAAGPVSP